ncbi:MAG: 2-phospho-L-lactate guanylyltransferase [Blastochloris sp.]|nr:2-phospho-L-lactate guanylyltransferase [Blastochloris sp.]
MFSKNVVAIVPIKLLDQAKTRLAPLLTPPERRGLVLAMLSDVLAALHQAPSITWIGVISRDAAALALATASGAETLYDEAADLNGALTQAARHYADLGARGILALPADVPRVTPVAIEALIAATDIVPSITLAPSRDGGTNALLARPPLTVPFRFGPNSLARHVEAAWEQDVVARLLHTDAFEDIDTHDDLRALADAPDATATQRFIREHGIIEKVSSKGVAVWR